MFVTQYEYLSGTLTVNADAPEDWQAAEELPFWTDPNNDAWGTKLCRVLYHESVHFWQFLSSAYIANLVAEEWSRLVRYEKTGVLLPASESRKRHGQTREGEPFSPSELAESWARYWDVHTRSPARIVREEGIAVDNPARLQIHSGMQIAYTGDAFDTVMQVGEDCAVYGRPYRWLLQQLHGHSAFAALVFPIMAHAAFSAPNPVEVFCRCVDKAKYSQAVQQVVNERTGSINLDWLTSYRSVVANVVIPIFEEMQRPSFLSGFDVIDNTVLQTHPIFSEYPSRFVIDGYLRLYYPILDADDPYGQVIAEALVEYARLAPTIVLGLPGQPFYRRALGRLVPPPKVVFRNMTWYARRPIVLKLQAYQAGEAFEDTYQQLSQALDKRIERFRAADKAVSLGLPPNAFD
jgi:hypothetical protein